MRNPQDWPTQPSKYGTVCVIWLDYGTGLQKTAGRAYPTDLGVVYADKGGWCTQYVKGWAPFSERNEKEEYHG